MTVRAYDAAGQRVQVVEFVYPEAEESEAGPSNSPDSEALEVLKAGLLEVIAGGHRSAAATRALALACVCGL